MNRTETAGPHPGRFDVPGRFPTSELRGEALERRLDEAGKRLEVVATLEDRRDPGGELRAPGGHVPEAVVL